MRRCLFAAFLLLTSAVPRVYGLAAYFSDLQSVYPTLSSRLNTCSICHNGPDPLNSSADAPRNAYGLSFASQPHAFNNSAANRAAISAIAVTDSDGDGVSNSSEISAGTFPGNPADHPDVVAPTVSITSPSPGPAYVSAQTVAIQATATDNVGVTQVSFLDNNVLRGTAYNAPYAFTWTFGPADNGPHNWTARAFDAAGNTADASVSLTVNIDNVRPTVKITSPAPGSLYSGPGTVVIRADASDNNGVAKVDFLDNDVLQATVSSPPYEYAWVINSNTSNGLHAWKARAFDAAGNTQDTSINLAVNLDSVPPTVNITVPADGAIYSSNQTVTIHAEASDNEGISKVEFLEDAVIQATLNAPPYEFAWSLGDVPNGLHTWVARAYDLSGNTADSLVKLTVNIDREPPIVSFPPPSSGTNYIAVQVVNLHVDATDNVGVAKVEFLLDSVTQATVPNPPFDYAWSLNNVANGQHTWTARAYDAAGNTKEATLGVTLNIDRDAPTVTITAPAAGSVFTNAQPVTIHADASDNTGIAKVEFLEDDVTQSTVVTPPYEYVWAVEASANGPHKWTARATDVAGNSQVSNIIVTVQIDVTPPSLSVTSVQDGALYVLPQTLNIHADATDDFSVPKVEFIKNNTPQSIVTAPPYDFAWAISKADNGTNSWTISATDAAGNTKSVSFNLIVAIESSGPSVAITEPPDKATFTSPQAVNVTATVNSTAGITKVEFYDSDKLRGMVTAPPFVYSWLVATNENGLHRWVARAYNTLGDFRDSAPVNLTVAIALPDTTPPAVTITEPGNGSAFDSAQTVTIAVGAVDDLGVAKVEFYEDSQLKSTVTTAPYTYAWAISSADNGTHVWGARAYDAAGNTSNSPPVQLTVNIGTPSVPQLSAARSGTHYTLSWFASDAGYVLQQASGLGPNFAWTNVPMGPVIADAVNRVVIGSPLASLRIRSLSTGLSLDWTGDGKLQHADSLDGPWLDIVNATVPYSVLSSGRAGFYRLRPVGQVFYRLHRP